MTAPQPEGPGAAEIRAFLRAQYRAQQTTDDAGGGVTAPDPTNPPAGRVRPNRSYWTSPNSWCDPDCIECDGVHGAPCCEPPYDPQRSTDANELSRQIGNLIAELDRQARLHEQAVQDWAGCRERLAEVEAELEQADHFGRGEFRITTWAYEQVCAALEKTRAQRAAVLALHITQGRYCCVCDDEEWPCPTARTLEASDA